MDLIDRIFLLLQQKNKKQNELAEFLGANIVTVSKWKSKKISPSVEHLAKIAEFLGCSTDYLIFGKEEATNHVVKTGIGNIIGNNIASTNSFYTQTQNQAPLGELEEEILNLCKKMSIKQKMELLQTAYSILEK